MNITTYALHNNGLATFQLQNANVHAFKVSFVFKVHAELYSSISGMSCARFFNTGFTVGNAGFIGTNNRSACDMCCVTNFEQTVMDGICLFFDNVIVRSTATQLWGQQCKLSKTYAQREVRQKFVSYRIVDGWK